MKVEGYGNIVPNDMAEQTGCNDVDTEAGDGPVELARLYCIDVPFCVLTYIAPLDQLVRSHACHA